MYHMKKITNVILIVIVLSSFISCCNDKDYYYLNKSDKKYILYSDKDSVEIIFKGDTLVQEITIESGMSQRKSPLGCEEINEEFIKTSPYYDSSSKFFSLKVSKAENKTIVLYVFHPDRYSHTPFLFTLVNDLPSEYDEYFPSITFKGKVYKDVFQLNFNSSYSGGSTSKLLFNLENGLIYMKDQNQDTIFIN